MSCPNTNISHYRRHLELDFTDSVKNHASLCNDWCWSSKLSIYGKNPNNEEFSAVNKATSFKLYDQPTFSFTCTYELWLHGPNLLLTVAETQNLFVCCWGFFLCFFFFGGEGSTFWPNWLQTFRLSVNPQTRSCIKCCHDFGVYLLEMINVFMMCNKQKPWSLT